VQIPAFGASDVILAQSGRFGGWSLWLQDGRPRFSSNWLGMERYEIAAGNSMTSGEHVLRFDFAYDGGKPGTGGIGRISLDGAKLAEGRIARTQPFIFSGDWGADVGEDLATPVTEDYQVPATFTGTIRKITIEVQPVLAADRKFVDEAAVEGVQRQAAFEWPYFYRGGLQGMQWIPGGTFRMGADHSYPEEAPVRTVTVGGFWMDSYTVTNAEFTTFVQASGYRTVAERPLDSALYPGIQRDVLKPGSSGFFVPTGRVDTRDVHSRWACVPGANWRHPT
jgi:hypothetical protein